MFWTILEHPDAVLRPPTVGSPQGIPGLPRAILEVGGGGTLDHPRPILGHPESILVRPGRRHMAA